MDNNQAVALDLALQCIQLQKDIITAKDISIRDLEYTVRHPDPKFVPVHVDYKIWDTLSNNQREAIVNYCINNVDHTTQDNKIQFIKRIREVFPYLSLKTAKDQAEFAINVFNNPTDQEF